MHAKCIHNSIYSIKISVIFHLYMSPATWIWCPANSYNWKIRLEFTNSAEFKNNIITLFI